MAPRSSVGVRRCVLELLQLLELLFPADRGCHPPTSVGSSSAGETIQPKSSEIVFAFTVHNQVFGQLTERTRIFEPVAA
jgi:hypothetical protein